MKIIAHRGDHTYEIENTIKALTLARQTGFYGIETDLRLTKDHQIVVCHDDSLARCFGENALISQLTFDEAKKLGVPSLGALFLALPQDYQIHLELKSQGSAKAIVQRYKDTILRRQRNLYITSFWHDELKIIKSLLPEIMVGAIIAGHPIWPIPKTICEATDSRALVLPLELCDKPIVTRMHDCGLKVFCWGVKTIHDLRQANSLEIDLIYSDVPTDDELKKILKKSC